jgi:hypothetical protein
MVMTILTNIFVNACADKGSYNDALLKAMIIEHEKIKLMEPHLKERIEELTKVVIHGAKFLVMGGAHLMTKNESEKEIEEEAACTQ